ncbi:LPS export ABC transporter permease LptF [Oleiagrimonas sp. C23AA]|uniref:LPS export ABC transporter permease LptF n=1 Tax=Oleiagrimonas sp. C23AA TaxID=2719047 RepID=UPI0014212246|nr:LPS export ABC transporter permease LptF [Oleiagrimonas sp. C23AA]NII12079.1 LPS export ABC transporter permease LptF [Oleiagrimonas sp. C23AA]
MLRILDRYFLRELLFSVLGTAIVLLVIVTGGTFAAVLKQVANGSFPASVMFEVLGLRMIDVQTALLPMALFLGVLTALGRLYRDSEMHVLASSGMGPRGLLRPVMLLGLPMVTLIALISLWWGPWSVRTANALVEQANRSVIAAGLEAGQFTELPGKGGIIFVDSMNAAGTKLGKVFVASDKPGDKTHPPKINVITAKRGQLYQESDGAGRFLALFDGWRYELPMGHLNWRRMQYARQDAALSSVQPGDDGGDNDPIHEMSTGKLFGARSSEQRAELAWRIASPMASLVLILLALPLSRQTPREPRYGRLLIAVLSYFIYLGLLSFGRALIGQGKVPNSAPLWGLHLAVAALALWMFWNQYRARVPKGAKA